MIMFAAYATDDAFLILRLVMATTHLAQTQEKSLQSSFSALVSYSLQTVYPKLVN